MSRVLIIGDTHCPAMRRGYPAFLKRIAADYDINRVVHIGDLVDWASLSQFNAAAKASELRRELQSTKRQIRLLVRDFPRADWLLGNHDARLQRRIETSGLSSEVIRSLPQILGVPWRLHPRFARLVIDGVQYQHGDSGIGGKNAALSQARNNFRSTVVGHFHSQAGVTYWANKETRLFGLAVGCGIDQSRLEFEYSVRFTAKPVLGCGVVVDGKRAYFEPWLLR